MKQITFLLIGLVLLSLLWCAGCGGGGQQRAFAPHSGMTSAQMTIKWPTRSRLLPKAANSIVVTLTGPGSYSASQTANRPADGSPSVVTFDQVPTGTVTMTATAYPLADGQGTPLATGADTQTGANGEVVRISITMDSTIDHLAITPANPQMNVSDDLSLHVTALNAAGDVVLTTPSEIRWSSGTPSVVSVQADSGLATALTEGTATITVHDAESGKTATTVITATKEYYRIKTIIGSHGTGDGKFFNPRDVTVTANGTIYVADTGNARIQKFNSAGMYLGEWGSYGSENGQFEIASSIATDSNGYIYVSDTLNDRIQKFSAMNNSGTYLLQWGNDASQNSSLSYPMGLAVDASNNIYVDDYNGYCMKKYTSTGSLVSTLPIESNSYRTIPTDVAVDATGNIYVATQACRINKYSSDFTFQKSWTTFSNSAIYGIAIDKQGNVYVSHCADDTISKYSGDGDLLMTWGTNSDTTKCLDFPMGLAVDDAGNVYVADNDNHRIVVYEPVD